MFTHATTTLNKITIISINILYLLSVIYN